MLDIPDHYRRGIPSRKPDYGQASSAHAIVICRAAARAGGSRLARRRAGLLAGEGGAWLWLFYGRGGAVTDGWYGEGIFS